MVIAFWDESSHAVSFMGMVVICQICHDMQHPGFRAQGMVLGMIHRIHRRIIGGWIRGIIRILPWDDLPMAMVHKRLIQGKSRNHHQVSMIYPIGKTWCTYTHTHTHTYTHIIAYTYGYIYMNTHTCYFFYFPISVFRFFLPISPRSRAQSAQLSAEKFSYIPSACAWGQAGTWSDLQSISWRLEHLEPQILDDFRWFLDDFGPLISQGLVNTLIFFYITQLLGIKLPTGAVQSPPKWTFIYQPLFH